MESCHITNDSNSTSTSLENGRSDASSNEAGSSLATQQVFPWMHGSRQLQKKSSTSSNGNDECSFFILKILLFCITCIR